MSNNRGHRLLEQLRRVARRGAAEPQTDGQLLEHFICRRDEAAFEMLLRRHGAMVRSVCRRVIGNADDADDAFQATFLILVRKADSVRPREAVGNWLYGVAYRTALEARGRLARRRAKEISLHSVPAPATSPRDGLRELWPILDRELSRLAERYRWPIVLCDLEGRSRKEAARQLAIPEGTLSSRLAAARQKLAKRLARWGFALSAVALATALAENTASAAVPASLFVSTTKAALVVAAGPLVVAGLVSATVHNLTEGVLKTMFLAKIKTATLVLCGVAALGLGTGGVYYQTRAGAADTTPPKSANRPFPPAGVAVTEENEKLRQTANEAKLRENELRDHLKKVLEENAKLQAELGELKGQLYRARKDQIKSGGAGAKPHEEPPPADPQRELRELDRKAEVMRRKFELKIKLLDEQRQKLDADQKGLIAEMKRILLAVEERKASIMKGAGIEFTPGSNPKKAGGDKLDRILERLERLEKRLDHLEGGRK